MSAISVQLLACTGGDRIQESALALFTFHFGEFDIASESDVVVAVICHFCAFSQLPRVLN